MIPLPSWTNGLKQWKLHEIGTKNCRYTPVQNKYFILRRVAFQPWHLNRPCTMKDLNTECKWIPFINLITVTIGHTPTARNYSGSEMAQQAKLNSLYISIHAILRRYAKMFQNDLHKNKHFQTKGRMPVFPRLFCSRTPCRFEK